MSRSDGPSAPVRGASVWDPSGRARWVTLFAATSRASRRRRSAAQGAAVVLAACATAVALFPLVDIVALVVRRGLALATSGMWDHAGGLGADGLVGPALGTAALAGVALVLASVLGIGAGIFVADWSLPTGARRLRAATDLMAGVPSIVIGYAGFGVLVASLGWGFSLLAGSVALAVVMLPYVVRATEWAIRSVPQELKEASLALGVSRTVTTHRVTFLLALPAVLRGLVLAFAIGVGETAPLLYTAAWSPGPPRGWLHHPVGYLTYVVWIFSRATQGPARTLAYVAAFVLIATILALHLLARAIPTRYGPAAGSILSRR